MSLKKRVQDIEYRHFKESLDKGANKAHEKLVARRRSNLEQQVVDLTEALEWHVGMPLEIILAERKLIKLKIAEQKKLVEETGSADLVQQPESGELTREGPKSV